MTKNKGFTKVNFKKGRGALFFIFLMMSMTGNLLARYDYPREMKKTVVGSYEKQVGDKLSRGLTNTLLGWMELGHTPTRWAQDESRSHFGAMVVGVPYGIVRTVGRTLTGVYEIVTAFAPQGPIFYPIEGDVL